MKRYFLTGVFVLLPIGATALIITWLFNLLDGWASPITHRLFGHHIPGLGLAITLSIIFLTGLFSSNVIGRWFLNALDHLFMDVPIFKSIYNTSKQVMKIFAPDKDAFRSVVLVEHPRTGSLSLGFVTHEMELTLNEKNQTRLAVYVPTNHLYFGDIYLFDPQEVHATHLSVQEGIQSVISAGASLPAQLRLEDYLKK
jgi:uncharacterized membrane protein